MNVLTEWLEQYFDEVSPREFYRGIFPEGELDTEGSFTKGKYTGIVVAVTDEKKKNGKPKIKRYTITDELKTVEDVCGTDDFCLCSPISYAGKERSAENARFLYAVAVDLDKLRVKDGKPVGLMNLWNGHIEAAGRIPKPTYIVSTGTGLHLYYVFDKAIPLFADTAKQMQDFKRQLTWLIWNESIVEIKDDREIQYEGIYQGFRMPGTITKQGDRTRAFLTGRAVTMDYMNSFAEEKYRVSRYATKTNLTLKAAAEKYPEWYEKRVVNKEPKGVWHVSRNLYDWWKRQILKGGRVGHRYYCLMTLAVYARKCSMYDEKHNPNPVTREELERDCFQIMEFFETLTNSDDNHFTEADVLDALEAFDDKWIVYPRDSIEYKSGIPMPRNKRNGRKQADHLKRARAVQNVDYPDGEWRHGNGRPSKEKIVTEWRANNPEGTPTEAARELKISRTTVYKYYNK